MAISHLAIVLLAALSLAHGVDIKYSELVGKHVVDLGMKLSYSDKEQTTVTPYNKGEPCTKDECMTPRFSNEDSTVLSVDFTVPPNLKDSTLKKSPGGDVIGKPVSILFKACYTKKFTINRKWRKAKDIIKKDKRCSQKMGRIDLPTTNSTLIFTLPSKTPSAQWFITAYVECDGGDKKVFCGVDTTGGISSLVSPALYAEKNNVSPEEAKGDLKNLATSDDVLYSTKVVESREPALFAAVIILSCVSVGLLVGFFIYEQVTRKNK